MRILYVEDDAADGDLTQRWMRRHAPQYRMARVGTRGDALQRLTVDAAAYDVVLTDVHLPDGDGIALLREIRLRGLPLAVVVITGAGSESIAVSALKAGADDYLVKNSNYFEQLPLTLESALHRHRAEAARRARPLRVLYAEHDQTDVTLTLRHFAQHARHIQLDIAGSGPEALERLTNDGAQPYDIGLLDFRMPGLDGIALLKLLRRQQKLVVPIVLITGQGDDEVMLQALRLGASSYVIKNPGYLYGLPAELENAHYRAKLEKDEAMLRDSEARTRAILRAIPDLMFVQTEDGVYLDYYAKNADDLLVPPEAFLGRNMREVLPPDLAAKMAVCFAEALDSAEAQVFEYELTIRDEERHFEARVVSAEAGQILSIVREITDRKRAEQALSRSSERISLLAGRLIAAQEEERVRIANELHDDLSQRMAALTISLSRLRQQMSEVPGSPHDDIAALERQAAGLADRTRALSHELHSAVLEHVGLSAALKSFCSDFAALDVDLELDALPAPISPSVQLCLYRVVQETLRNAGRHSGAARARVRLTQTKDVTELTVSDSGAGFDAERARYKGGLGLISLEERVRLVGGSLQISTGPGRGTELRVRVPVAAD